MTTKVRLAACDNKNFKVEMHGTKFHSVLQIIRDMPVRIYDKQEGVWKLPIIDVGRLVKELKRINVIDVRASVEVRDQWVYYLEWKKNQLEIKHYDMTQVEDIRTEMNASPDLFPFQVIGSYFLYKAGDALMGDWVGLGKSVQSITAIEKHMSDKNINFCIVICPSTLKRNWEDEIAKWTPKSSVIIKGDKAKRKKLYKQAYKYDYMIINYDLLNYDIELITEYILNKGYVYSVLIDEAQYCKNSRAKRSNHAKSISQFAKYSIGLSATAIENTVMDLWSVFQVIDESVFGGNKLYWHFKEKFVKMDWFGNCVGYKDEKTIKERMAPYIIRRMTEDVLDQLPEKIENNYWVDLSPVQRQFYDEISSQIVTQISDMEKAEKIKYADILPMITYLRQCCLSAKLVGHPENISTKTDQLLDFLESIDDKSKVVCFSHFVGMVELLKQTLDKYKYKNICMHGQGGSELYCPTDKRVDVIKQFNTEPYRILVASDILTEGVNITSANYIINFDMLFNPAKMWQRIGRIDRIGNKHKVINIINIIATNTIEEQVFKTFMEKTIMSRDILDDNKVEKRLTVKDIKSLLEVKTII